MQKQAMINMRGFERPKLKFEDITFKMQAD